MVVLAGQVASRDGVLLDVEEGLARRAVEKKQESSLGCERHRLDRRAVSNNLDQRRLRGQVPVPNVVVNGLEVPAAAARPAIQRHKAVSEEVCAGAVSAVVVVRRRAQRGHMPVRGPRRRWPSTRDLPRRGTARNRPPMSRFRTRRSGAQCGNASGAGRYGRRTRGYPRWALGQARRTRGRPRRECPRTAKSERSGRTVLAHRLPALLRQRPKPRSRRSQDRGWPVCGSIEKTRPVWPPRTNRSFWPCAQ